MTSLTGRSLNKMLGRRPIRIDAGTFFLYLTKGGGWIPITMLCISVSISALCIIDILERRAFFDNSPQTTGVISRFECPKYSSECYVMVSYSVNGSHQELTDRQNPSPFFRSGDVVSIAYRRKSDQNIDARIVESPFRIKNVLPLFIAGAMQAFLIFAISETLTIFAGSKMMHRSRSRSKQ